MKIMKNFISAIFAAMVLIPVLCIGGRIFQYHSENTKLKQVAEIAAEYTVHEPAVSLNSQTELEMESFMDINGLKTENADVVGFVEIPGTIVSYPVMKSEEADYYIRRGFDKKRSIYGSIYMDNACYENGANTVLYGHNMKSGKMFGTLRHYMDAAYREEHKEIRYITDDRIECYDVCAVFLASAADQDLIKNLIPYTKEEMENLQNYIANHQGVFMDEFAWGDRLLTLATCEYPRKAGRLFVIGKLKDTIIRKES